MLSYPATDPYTIFVFADLLDILVFLVVTAAKASRRNHQKYKPQMEQRSAGGMTSSNVKTGAKPLHSVVAVWKSLHFALSLFAVKQSQFGKFLLFFSLPILHLFVVVHDSVN